MPSADFKKPIKISEATHKRLESLKKYNGRESFDELINRLMVPKVEEKPTYTMAPYKVYITYGNRQIGKSVFLHARVIQPHQLTIGTLFSMGHQVIIDATNKIEADDIMKRLKSKLDESIPIKLIDMNRILGDKE